MKKNINELNNYDWLNYLASKLDHAILKEWSFNQEKFWDKYMIIDDEEVLIIGDKHSYAIYEFAKQAESFAINFEKKEPKNKKLFGFKNIEVIKKEVV
jgi:hypothetical protein